MKIALVDQNLFDIEKLHSTLKQLFDELHFSAYEIDEYHSAEAFLASTSIYDVMICEIALPEMNGIELAGKMKEKCPRTKVVFGTGTNSFAQESYEVGAAYYYQKPVNENKLKKMLKRVL